MYCLFRHSLRCTAYLGTHSDAIAARFTAARKAAQAQLDEEEKAQAVRLAEATARAMEQEQAAEKTLTPPKAESSTPAFEARSTPGAPPAAQSNAPRRSRAPSLPKTEKVAMQRRRRVARTQLGAAPSQARAAPAISPWARTQMRTHSRKVKEKSPRQPVNRQPLYKPPAIGNHRQGRSSGGHRILPSTRSSRAQVLLAQAKIARELRSRKQIQWAHLHLHEEAWEAEKGRVAGGMRPYMPGASCGGAALAHYVLDEQQGLEERIKSMVPMVSHLSLKARLTPENSSTSSSPKPPTEKCQPSRPPAYAQLTRQYSTLSPAQPLARLSQSGCSSSTPPGTPTKAHHTQHAGATTNPQGMHATQGLAQCEAHSESGSLARPILPTSSISARHGGSKATVPHPGSSANAACPPSRGVTGPTVHQCGSSATATSTPPTGITEPTFRHPGGSTAATGASFTGNSEPTVHQPESSPTSTNPPSTNSTGHTVPQPGRSATATGPPLTAGTEPPSHPGSATSPQGSGTQSHHHWGNQTQHHTSTLPHHHRIAHVRIATPPQGSPIIPTTGAPIKLSTPSSGDPCAPSTLLPPATLLAQQHQQQQQQQQRQQQQDQCSEAEAVSERMNSFPTQQQQPPPDQSQQYTQQHNPARMASPDIPDSRVWSTVALGPWGQRPPVPPPYQLYPVSAPSAPYSSPPLPNDNRHNATLLPPRLSYHPVSPTTLQPPPNEPASAAGARAATAAVADSALPNFPRTTALPPPRHHAVVEETAQVADPKPSCELPTAAPHYPQAKVPMSGSWPAGLSSNTPNACSSIPTSPSLIPAAQPTPMPTAHFPLTSSAHPALEGSPALAPMTSRWQSGPRSPTPAAQSLLTSSAHLALISSAPIVHPGSPTHPQRFTAQPQHAAPPTSIEAATALHAVTPTQPHLAQCQGAPEVAGRGSVRSAVPHSGAQQQQQQQQQQQASQFLPGAAAALEAQHQRWQQQQQHHHHHHHHHQQPHSPAGVQHHQLQHHQHHRHQQQQQYHHHQQPKSQEEVQTEASPRLPQLPKTPPCSSETEQPLQKESHKQQQLPSPSKEQQMEPLPPAVNQKPLPPPVNTAQQQSDTARVLPPLPTSPTPNPTPRGPFPPQMPFIPSPHPPSAYSHMNPHTHPAHTRSRFSRTHSAPPLSSASTVYQASHSSPSPHQTQQQMHQAGHSSPDPHHTQLHQAAQPASERASLPTGMPKKLSTSRPVNPEGPLSSMGPPSTPFASARAWVSIMRAPPPGLMLSPSSPTPPAQGSARKRRTRKKSHLQVRAQQQEQHSCGSDAEEQFQQQRTTTTPSLQKPVWQGVLYSPGSSVAGHGSAGAEEQGFTQGSALMGQLAHHPPESLEAKML
ncbi:hypothetical protein DUNSADRAFT_10420 [Dunaliella salina]|uniref:Uncharacterized protein n=1 Tax=Dunaliella salina TaxID=3046 RepID=A0ABQ7GFG3_DUNSA|nr:hypothetical protein DUNSADRAFT_10420 [Dunaliella salina]|eukprot:KAF5833339.1 hypothetical protein DUNSADRAFT_10420 [Dunaliella salina]